ncbi:hypothetical protein PRIPAC_91369 [Pristionchus pacificus]|uniref:Uncharacterized protein n=1 Tax=Pristionchus pacificus TaxID=54126 RepID=A0A2A6CZD2_PRIPA|nr:hypothetical protein PRIPAC_91369 [Pristionchus pacificus]|eukprot:PDM83391.1 hypothetical protein PRIPAC_35023 [Pristionchus pacificus]
MAGRRSTTKRHYDDFPSTIEPEDREPKFREKREPVLERLNQDRTPHEFIAFDSRFVRAMLKNVKVLTIGDSLMRGLYKDLVSWTQSDSLCTDVELKAKSESTFRGDRLIDISLLSDDKVFRQAREYQRENFLIQFQFTTRVMKDDIELLVQQMLGEDGYPDVILINSMIWDLTRYFKVSTDTAYSDNVYQKRIEIECMQKYLDRTSMLLRRFRAILPPHTMVIWVCFPHCRPSIPRGNGRGGGMQFQPLAHERNHFIRSVMVDGNFRVSQVVRNAGYDVLDIGFYMRNHAFYHYQKDDGMHWLPAGVRLMSQLVVQFLAKSWGIDTSGYLSRLEGEQKRKDALKIAAKQLTDYNFQRSAVEELSQYGRTLSPFVQPVRRCLKRVPQDRFNPNPRQSVVAQIRMAPRIDREMAHEVDDLSTKLLAMTNTVKNMIREDSRRKY